MKKLLALLGVALLAGCQMPGSTDDETMEEENMAPPMEEVAPAPEEEPAMEEEAAPEEAAAETDVNVEMTNDLGEAI